jgi:hypothetical protein
MPGMLCVIVHHDGSRSPWRIDGAECGRPVRHYSYTDHEGYGARGEEYAAGAVEPDPTDPATMGCLLGLVREAWGPACPVTIAYHPDADPGDDSGWAVEVGDRPTRGTLWDALCAALAAAPEGA